MRNEEFEYFISKFGEATHRSEVPSANIEKWRGKLPDQLLVYWQEEGWCSYADGLFWTVDPDDYEDLVDEWLDGSRLDELDSFHVVARSAFGDLYLCGERTGCSVDVNCSINVITTLQSELHKKDDQELNRRVKNFFAFKKATDCDLKDESRTPLFKRALEKLGPLKTDEMYGFEPALVLGGKMTLDHLRIVKLDQHLTILRQLAAPTMPFANLDIDELLK